MFRRENQGESFDDDVAALRDRAGSTRRDQSESMAQQSDDQTTYSPPRQTWSPVQSSSDPDQPAPVSSPPQRQPDVDASSSVIAAHTSWDGSVQSSGSLHIHGNVSGQINAEGDVFIAEGANVNAELRAGSVTVAGTVEGSVECSGRFEVLPTGRVSANVAAPRLVVHEGAHVVGKLRMTTDGTSSQS
jgi:cytoskeletal protein CcmA (bactofilin family)